MKNYGKKEKPDQKKIGLEKDQKYRSTRTVQREVKRKQDSNDQEADRHKKDHQLQRHLFVTKDVRLKSESEMEK
jgi:hypothetical protein